MRIHLKRWMKSVLAVSLLMGASSVQADLIVVEQKLINGVKTGTNVGGDSVAIDGEWAFVGDVDECQVFIYKYDYITNLWGDGGYNGTATPDPVLAGEPYMQVRPTGSCKTGEYGGFGKSVSTSDGVVAIGSPDSKDGGSIRHGKIFVYYFDPAMVTVKDDIDNRGGWVRYTAIGLPEDRDDTDPTIINTDLQDGAEFGSVVSVRRTPGSDKAILSVGAPGYDETNPVAGENTGSNEGKVYVYEWSITDNNATLINGQAGEYPQDHVGTAVTSNGTELIASAPYWDNNGTGDFPLAGGAVYLFGYDVNTFAFTFEHRIQSGGYFTPGPNYPVDGSGSTTDLDGTDLQANQHLGWTLSYVDSVIALGGINTYLYDHVHGSHFLYVSKKVDTDHADVSQSGNIINIAVRGDQNVSVDRNGSFNVYFNKHDMNPLPAPNVTYSKAESDYGRDISLDVPRLMVNGNENTTDGQGTGIAYAYHPTCGTGGELIANEWQVIGLQCDNILSGTSEASIDDMFSDDLGTYGVDWGMYSREAPNYDGRSSSYHWMASTEPMKVGVGYWIVWLGTSGGDGKYKVDTPLTATSIAKRPDYMNRTTVGAITTLDLKALMTNLGADTPTGRDGSTQADMRVLLANPLLTPTKWIDATWLTSASGLESGSYIQLTSPFFEGGAPADVVVYTYDLTSNWWLPVTATDIGVGKTTIAPGQGFNVKFSQTFYDAVLKDSNVTACEFGLAEAK